MVLVHLLIVVVKFMTQICFGSLDWLYEHRPDTYARWSWTWEALGIYPRGYWRKQNAILAQKAAARRRPIDFDSVEQELDAFIEAAATPPALSSDPSNTTKSEVVSNGGQSPSAIIVPKSSDTAKILPGLDMPLDDIDKAFEWKLDSSQWPFSDIASLSTMALTTRHIMEECAPIVKVDYNSHTETWKVHCGNHIKESDIRIVPLQVLYLMDPTIGVLANFPNGFCAIRQDEQSSWQVQSHQNHATTMSSTTVTESESESETDTLTKVSMTLPRRLLALLPIGDTTRTTTSGLAPDAEEDDPYAYVDSDYDSQDESIW
jgi:hypothetical protein